MLKKYINKLISLFGYKIVKTTVIENLNSNFIDLRDVDINIFDLLKSYSKINTKFLVYIDISKITMPRVFDTWIETVKIIQKEDSHSDITHTKSFKYLKHFYKSYTPKNISEYLNISTENNQNYFSQPPIYAVSPWRNISPDKRLAHLQKTMTLEYKRYGIKKIELIDGHKFFGPISDRLLLIEFLRLKKLYESLKTNKFDINKSLIYSLHIYKKNDDYRIELLDGLHRTAVLVALGYKKIPIIISNQNTSLIKRERVKLWTNVKNGLYTEEQALKLFDKKFD